MIKIQPIRAKHWYSSTNESGEDWIVSPGDPQSVLSLWLDYKPADTKSLHYIALNTPFSLFINFSRSFTNFYQPSLGLWIFQNHKLQIIPISFL